MSFDMATFLKKAKENKSNYKEYFISMTVFKLDVHDDADSVSTGEFKWNFILQTVNRNITEDIGNVARPKWINFDSGDSYDVNQFNEVNAKAVILDDEKKIRVKFKFREDDDWINGGDDIASGYKDHYINDLQEASSSSDEVNTFKHRVRGQGIDITVHYALTYQPL